jgi:hypothetical protein
MSPTHRPRRRSGAILARSSGLCLAATYPRYQMSCRALQCLRKRACASAQVLRVRCAPHSDFRPILVGRAHWWPAAGGGLGAAGGALTVTHCTENESTPSKRRYATRTCECGLSAHDRAPEVIDFKGNFRPHRVIPHRTYDHPLNSPRSPEDRPPLKTGALHSQLWQCSPSGGEARARTYSGYAVWGTGFAVVAGGSQLRSFPGLSRP